jgi:hypothetical protein
MNLALSHASLLKNLLMNDFMKIIQGLHLRMSVFTHEPLALFDISTSGS